MTAISTSSKHVEETNFHHLVMDIAWFGLAMAATSRFLQFYAIRMGASAMDLGWLMALPAAILVFATGLSHWWHQRHTDSVQAVILPGIGFRFVFLLPALAPFFPPEWRIPWVILAATLPAVAQGISSTVFLVMMRETVSAERLTPLFTRRALALNITVTLGALGFGLLLENMAFPQNYQLMFVLAFAFSMVSQWHVNQLHPIKPARPAVPATGKHRKQRTSSLALLRSPYFQSVALVTLVSHIAFFSVFAVIPLRLERDLGATEGFMALYGIAELLAGAGTTLVLGRIVRSIGNRATIAWSMAGTGVAALFIGLAPALWLTLPAAALSGAAWTAASIGTLGFFSERSAPDDIQSAALFHQMIFAAMFIGPLIGGSLASSVIPISAVLVFGAGLRLLAAGLVTQGLAAFGRRRIEALR